MKHQRNVYLSSAARPIPFEFRIILKYIGRCRNNGVPSAYDFVFQPGIHHVRCLLATTTIDTSETGRYVKLALGKLARHVREEMRTMVACGARSLYMPYESSAPLGEA